MSADGKQLEALVAYVEQAHLPEGFVVTANERVYNDEGIQIAEFDIEIRGSVGTTAFAWLIECRDRPAHGPAPGSWIEQLVGRRTRFGFNKVTAVSTTGFATGAAEFALAQGIELREVRSLEPSEFADWLQVHVVEQAIRHSALGHAEFIASDSQPPAARATLERRLAEVTPGSAFLRSSTTNQMTSPAEAFSAAADTVAGLFDNLVPNGSSLRIALDTKYLESDHFLIDTDEGPIPIVAIVFHGEVKLILTKHPLVRTAEYRIAETGAVISQVASFAPQTLAGMSFATELHKLATTGETHVILRRIVGNA